MKSRCFGCTTLGARITACFHALISASSYGFVWIALDLQRAQWFHALLMLTSRGKPGSTLGSSSGLPAWTHAGDELKDGAY